jgi:hypothetical protein
MAANSSGDVFVPDYAANRVPRVDHASGATTIYVGAGSGAAAVGGDGGPATAAGNSRDLAERNLAERDLAERNHESREMMHGTNIRQEVPCRFE